LAFVRALFFFVELDQDLPVSGHWREGVSVFVCVSEFLSLGETPKVVLLCLHGSQGLIALGTEATSFTQVLAGHWDRLAALSFHVSYLPWGFPGYETSFFMTGVNGDSYGI